MLPSAANNASVVCMPLGCAHKAGRKVKMRCIAEFQQRHTRELKSISSQKLCMQLLIKLSAVNSHDDPQ
jgi:hypothetical protein